MVRVVMGVVVCAVCVWGSPVCRSAVEELVGVDEDCFKDDLAKVCGVDEEQCRQKCNSDVRCGAYVVNYKEGDGPNPRWDDGCCWLKKACSTVKKMEGKKRQIVRPSNLIPPTPHPFQHAVKGLYYGVEDATNTALDAFKATTKKDTRAKITAGIREWAERKKLETAHEKHDAHTARAVEVADLPFAVPTLRY
eukprot:TRINITY_DN29467_c0_g1_i1.p1 TRINITY_DN29467_c0_g1~~TRINITY_DN29467_c0_g1_i1.p1  ORF type:complete len:193 (+),score=65.60 TRINITY_DN29467_c0_g1_i1:34-612(+)